MAIRQDRYPHRISNVSIFFVKSGNLGLTSSLSRIVIGGSKYSIWRIYLSKLAFGRFSKPTLSTANVLSIVIFINGCSIKFQPNIAAYAIVLSGTTKNFICTVTPSTFTSLLKTLRTTNGEPPLGVYSYNPIFRGRNGRAVSGRHQTIFNETIGRTGNQ